MRVRSLNRPEPGRAPSSISSSTHASRATLLLLAAAATLVAGCSTPFSKAWDAAARSPLDPAGISGRWIGTWQNTNNTHSDRMRAVLERVSPTEYRARFHAKYRKVLGFKYETRFHGDLRDGVFVFEGEEDLGALAGGLYRYTGQISPTNFFSTYDSKYDSGTFTLRRPE